MEYRKQSNRGGQSVKRAQTRHEKDMFRGEYVLGLPVCSLMVGDSYYLASYSHQPEEVAGINDSCGLEVTIQRVQRRHNIA